MGRLPSTVELGDGGSSLSTLGFTLQTKKIAIPALTLDTMQTHKQRRAGTMCLPGDKEYLWRYSTQHAYALEEA
jgi:hypothetical protein